MAKWKDEQIFKEGNSYKVFLPEKNKLFTVDNFGITGDLVGLYVDDVEFNDEGKINWLKIDGEKYRFKKPAVSNPPPTNPRSTTPSAGPQNTTPRRDESREMAPSPYNFVSLNQTVVPSNAQVNDFSVYKGLSGYIDVTVTTQTPMFIRGKNEEFFKIGEEMAIPGSSFRGLIRTMVEVLSYGKFVNFEDRELYHRLTVIDDTKSEKDGIKKKIGFLRFDQSEKSFHIYEAKEIPAQYDRPSNYSQDEFTYRFERINEKVYVKINTGSFGGQNHLIKNFKILYEQKQGTSGIPIGEKIVKSFRDDDTRKTKKDMANLLGLAEKPRDFTVKLPDGITYIGIPIWYEIDANQNIVSFGHCKNYRVPYDYSIGNHSYIPTNIQNETITDFAESIFGKSKSDLTAGKVYFEDLKVGQTLTIEENILNTLATPKPTAYQMYLEQDGKPLKTWSNKAKIRGYKQYWHRDTNQSNQYNWRNATIRKLDFDKFRLTQHEKDQIVSETIYQHRNGQIQLDSKNNPIVEIYKTKNYAEWPKSIQEKVSKIIMNNDTIQFSVIQAIPPNTFFTGRIRFDNLSPEELGALLCALNLPEGCCHKIGMGKPLGLGSVQVTTELILINREERYSQLFEGNGWSMSAPVADGQPYKRSFHNYVIEQLRNTGDMEAVAGTFWDLPRMKQLKHMLTFDINNQSKTDWLNKTKYQELKEFKNRTVLPKPEEVK